MKSYWGIFKAYLDVDTFNRNQEQSKMYTISKIESYLLGAVLSAVVAGMTLFVLGFVSLFLPIGFINAFTLVAAFGAGIAFFGAGIIKLEVGYIGVLVVLGERLKNVQLGEGIFWLFPFFTGAEYVDGRQQYSDTKEVQAITSDNVDLHIDADLTWRIVDAYKRQSSNVRDVEGAVKAAANAAIVSVTNRDDRDRVFASHNEPVGADSHYEKMSKLERQIAEEVDSKIQLFGGETLKVYLSTLLPNAELIAQERRIPIEKAQRDAEQIQNKHVIDEIERFAEATGLSREAATQAVLTQMGKATLNIDQKNLSLNQETRQTIEELAKIFAGSRGGQSN